MLQLEMKRTELGRTKYTGSKKCGMTYENNKAGEIVKSK